MQGWDEATNLSKKFSSCPYQFWQQQEPLRVWLGISLSFGYDEQVNLIFHDRQISTRPDP
jgi:hypothetical protein